MLFRSSRLIGMSFFVVVAKDSGEVVGTTNEVNRVGNTTLDSVGLLDLGVFEEEFLFEAESGIVPHRFPRSVTVLPYSDQKMSVVFDTPITVPVGGTLDVLDG